MGGWSPTIIRDVLAQDISSALDIDYQDFQPAVVFVNGEYWGIHTIRDRIDERYIEYTYHIDKDSVEFLEGSNIHYLTNFIENNSLEYSHNYNYIATQIDIPNYIDYTIAELFFNNYDWPGNNMKLWRKIPDGKWRWVFYDIDAGFGNENYNMLLHATNTDSALVGPNPPHSTFLFRSLLQNETFKTAFITRYAEILNTYFDTSFMINKLDSIQNVYSPEIPVHADRWHYPNSLNQWEEDVESDLLTFLKNRPCIVREQIMSFFQLTSFDFECETKLDERPGLGQLVLAPNPNNGRFFLLNTGAYIADATITITSANGQEVYKESGVDIMTNQKKHFDLSGFAQNIYLLQVVANDFSEQKKIIIVP
ncbi:MAG: hypothetical protein CSB02_00050 [Bacteroidia bacterium]|nr:MAG: hypothetical protein CSB02_00050 [Bacteroidia bacterium]